MDFGVLERRAQVILLVRAVEEADPGGRLLPLFERTKATRRALVVTGLSEDRDDSAAAWKIRSGEAVLRRARQLLDYLLRIQPGLRRMIQLARLGSSTAPVVLGLAFVIGAASNVLGLGRNVNLLSLPLLALIAWNLALYTVMIASSRRRIRGDEGCAGWLCEWFFRNALGRRLHNSRIVEGQGTEESRILVRAAFRFGALWHRLAAPLLAARVRRLMHVGALAVVAGAVFGMYMRGVAFEFRATWESTWLDATTVRAILGVVLGPASYLSGIEIPDVDSLGAAPGPAGPWIHLYAISGLLFVGIPRAALALWEGWRCMRLSQALPLDLEETYYRRLFTAWRGSTHRVTLVPYSYTPRPGALASLKTLLFDFFGARADIRELDPAVYGDEAQSLLTLSALSERERDAGFERCIVLVMNLAQTPETEVHGRLLREIRDGLDRESDRMLVVLDGSGYVARTRDAQRLRERQMAWTRVLRDAGLDALRYDLDTPAAPAGTQGESTKDGVSGDRVEAMRTALWPPEPDRPEPAIT